MPKEALMRKNRLTFIGVALVLAISGCAGSGDSSGPSDPVIIGTSLSLTGSLGPLGEIEQQGYRSAVDAVNASGGLPVGQSRRPVKLVVLDNRSDPNMASEQARELILKENASALLGACTPPIVIPVALVAEAQQVPMVTTCVPTGAFTDGNKAGWHYSWDMFFSEQQQASSTAAALKSSNSNGRVALFTDTEPDGLIERGLYKQAVNAAGLSVVGDYTFPVGTSDFSSFINDAKAKGVELVVAQTVPPDGIALWKQLKALALRPKAAFSAKAAVTGSWWQALGTSAEGTLTEGFWAASPQDPRTIEILGTLGKQIKNLPDLGLAVVSRTAAQVLLDAITAAGTSHPEDINRSVANTNKNYPVGDVSFSDGKHVSVTDHISLQWHDGNAVPVGPPTGASIVTPPAGLS
jgi:branched-chain amino acid transport system substrate-binding protein